MSDILISYKREDQAAARKLADALERRGWTVWWDPKLRAGERVDDAIERALAETACVIVLWSHRSVLSPYVRDEAAYALSRGKLIPAAIENVTLPFRFEGIQTAQLVGWDGTDTFPGFQKLLHDLTAVLGAPPARRTEGASPIEERETENEHKPHQPRAAPSTPEQFAEPAIATERPVALPWLLQPDSRLGAFVFYLMAGTLLGALVGVVWGVIGAFQEGGETINFAGWVQQTTMISAAVGFVLGLMSWSRRP